MVVKGPPWLPSVSGDRICNDMVDDACIATGTCTSCFTFNQADIDHIKSVGWNSIRLGVIWAGAQPHDENALDPEFLQRLHAVLNLTDANGIHVVLDNHGDMVGPAGCGNGVPMWFQKKAAPDLIGKPLRTGLPYSSIPLLRVSAVKGYQHCGRDAAKWAVHAGDPYYNLKNPCCQAMNAYPSEVDDKGELIYNGNPPGLGFTTISQKTMDYMMQEGPGRDYFIRFLTLLAEAVKDHPSAFAVEPMNEPLTIRRKWMFDTWRTCAESINKIIPDMLVSICDVGQGSVMPAWVTQLTGGAAGIPKDIVEWIKNSNNLFYTWHYGEVPQNVKNMQAISKAWNMPTFATETFCDHWDAAAAAGISRYYWHYSSYCNTGPAFGNRSVVTETFGACILGWDLGDSSKCAKQVQSTVENDDDELQSLVEERQADRRTSTNIAGIFRSRRSRRQIVAAVS